VIAMLMAGTTAFLLTFISTPVLIRRLRRQGIGQQIRDDGPIAHPHVAKAGTPTMGGLAMVGAVVVAYVVAHIRHNSVAFSSSGWTLLTLIVGLGAVGFLDDYLGVRARRNLGLRKRGKTLGMVAVAAVFAWMALNFAHISTHLSFTRPLSTNLGTVGWFLFAILIVYATANAVNLTDGLDGLAAGSSAFVFAAFMIIAFTEFRHPTLYGGVTIASAHVISAQALDQMIIAAAMFGACAGFLWWNAAPAQIIMGDTGSLAIGGAMAGLALLTRTALLLPILAGLPVLEALSVVAQVVSYRGFRRRVLRMAPIHHHFEVGGWSEFTVTVRFWLFAGICVALAIGIFYADFLHLLGPGLE
jgi:phospho-N-acetylmuramoyl-pentapeptide-transferase